MKYKNSNSVNNGESKSPKLVAGFPPRRPWFKPRVWSSGICGGQTSVSPANLHSTKFSITITRGRYNRPFSGRRAEWTQFGIQPPQYEFKKKVLNLFEYLNSNYANMFLPKETTWPEFPSPANLMLLLYSECKM
jgi:hypothetical protein